MFTKFSYSQPIFLKDVFMKVILDSLLEGAARARGTVIIIDVFRAFTTAAVAFSRGASHIYLVSEVEEALDLRRRGIAQLCMGEVGGVKPDGFNFGANFGEVAGAGIKEHVHLHIVPRWIGDTNFMPVMGHTKVMIEGLKETRKQLATAFSNNEK